MPYGTNWVETEALLAAEPDDGDPKYLAVLLADMSDRTLRDLNFTARCLRRAIDAEQIRRGGRKSQDDPLCSWCGGDGWLYDGNPDTLARISCERCGGSGRVATEEDTPAVAQFTAFCADCGGTGVEPDDATGQMAGAWSISAACSRCGGSGQSPAGK